MSTITKTYFINAQFLITSTNQWHTVPCIVESDVDGERRGLFVWPMMPEHEHLLCTDQKFQDGLYEAISLAVFNMRLDTFLENGLIKAPSGSTWHQHIKTNKAYTLGD